MSYYILYEKPDVFTYPSHNPCKSRGANATSEVPVCSPIIISMWWEFDNVVTDIVGMTVYGINNETNQPNGTGLTAMHGWIV